MRISYFALFASFGMMSLALQGASFSQGENLFRDLSLVHEIDKQISDALPFFYNYSFMGGYYNMPSARMPKMGAAAIGISSVPPYYVFGANFQVLERIELSANYRVFKGMLEKNFGHEGFGDDADRIGNVKFGILMPQDGFRLPSLVFGLDDFIGTKRFNSQYFVFTQEWIERDLEVSLGWGKGRIKGFFGGIAWTPWRQKEIPFLRNLSLLAEYDAIDYKKHVPEHQRGRSVNFRFNAGLGLCLGDVLQLSLSSVRGKKLAGSASLRYPLGTTKGIFPKIDDPLPYHCPVDTEPLGVSRPEEAFAQDLAYSFSDQGLDLFSLYLSTDCDGVKLLWMKVVNNRYREEAAVRLRIENLLAALTPSDITKITVVVESVGLASHQYCFRREDLERFRLGKIGVRELETLSPMREASHPPDEYEAALLYQRDKEIWTFTAHPRLLTFFGSTKGKFKYSLGMVSAFEGYLYDEVYYKMQLSYSAISSMKGLTSSDVLNPSKLLHVRTDSLKYHQTNTVSMEQAYAQRCWNLGRGYFFRFAGGYFEPAYAGLSTECLLYPVNSNWAVGLEAAGLLKRHYKGFGFFRKIPKTQDEVDIKKKYIGLQYFLDVYWNFKPLDLNFKATLGQFLARDKGIRFEVMRLFPSGLRFSLWLTLTNGHDKVNGKTYFDKGFAFAIPFDVFLKQSSRNFINFSMSAWLRDVGAISANGKQLYPTLYEERFD